MTKPRPIGLEGDLLHIALNVPFSVRTVAENDNVPDAIALRRYAFAFEHDGSFEDQDRLVQIIVPLNLPSVQDQIRVVAVRHALVETTCEWALGLPSMIQDGSIGDDVRPTFQWPVLTSGSGMRTSND